MLPERIDESLSRVCALFEGGTIRPLFLEWAGRRYHVRRTNASWIDRSSRARRHEFCLTMQTGDVFEVAYDERRSSWLLKTVLTE